jgi:hypothetical protein
MEDRSRAFVVHLIGMPAVLRKSAQSGRVEFFQVISSIFDVVYGFSPLQADEN